MPPTHVYRAFQFVIAFLPLFSYDANKFIRVAR